MPTLHKSAHLFVHHYLASAYVCVTRSKQPFESISEANAAFTACRLAFGVIDESRHGILYDWRQVPISTDPNLHKALVVHMDALAEPFSRRAILLASAVGTMQVNRVGRNLTDRALAVFGDEGAALDFVMRR